MCNMPVVLQEILKALIGFLDVAGLYFALTQLTYRNISQTHKFQAIGLGKLQTMILLVILNHGCSLPCWSHTSGYYAAYVHLGKLSILQKE